MAHSDRNDAMHNARGAIGKQVVFKKMNGKTIISKYPDRSQVQYTKEQLEYRKLFAKAVEFARGVLKDPVQKAAFLKKIRNNRGKYGTSVYHVALKDFMDRHSRRVPPEEVEAILQFYRETYPLSERQANGIRYLIRLGRLMNAVYQQLNDISKATATRDLQDLVQRGVIAAPETKGAGAIYKLLPLAGAPYETDETEQGPDE
jgi:hypothetical protein